MLTSFAGDWRTNLQSQLEKYIKGRDARFGIAVIVDGRDTISVNGTKDFPMMSVYKFPQALALAEQCIVIGNTLTDTIDISANELYEDTWSPMRDKYGKRDLRLPLSEILAYSLQQSDNNACDILFRLIGGPKVADGYVKHLGLQNTTIESTEKEIRDDNYLCYLNRTTPLEMASLFNMFNDSIRYVSPEYGAIARLLETCQTGADRLARPLNVTNAVIGHKTGSGFITPEGRITAVNDAGYVNLPNGHHYSIAVFIADANYTQDECAAMIGDISEIVFKSFSNMKEPMQPDGIVRLSRIEVYPQYLDEYLGFATEVGTVSLQTEPGVLTMYALQDKNDPCKITILETYASQEAYKSHIASPHFQKYKQGTLHMVKSLSLDDQTPLNPKNKITNYIEE